MKAVQNTNNRNQIKLESKRMGTSWSQITRGKQTNEDPKKAAKEVTTATAMATQTTPSSVEAAMKQEAKQNEELIADWDEMYVGVSMMLSVSTCNFRKSLVECFIGCQQLKSVRSSFVYFSDPPNEFILPYLCIREE
jgi:hypothetical protein